MSGARTVTRCEIADLSRCVRVRHAATAQPLADTIHPHVAVARPEPILERRHAVGDPGVGDEAHHVVRADPLLGPRVNPVQVEALCLSARVAAVAHPVHAGHVSALTADLPELILERRDRRRMEDARDPVVRRRFVRELPREPVPDVLLRHTRGRALHRKLARIAARHDDHARDDDCRRHGWQILTLHVQAQMGAWSLAPARSILKPTVEPGHWLGRYELQDLLGCGGMGVVYRANDPVIGRKVAVKVLSTHGSRRSERQSVSFLSELRILGSIVHDNVVRVYDYGEVNDVRYIVMELLEGEDLGRAILGGTFGDLAQKLTTMRQVAAALQHIHAEGIVHRDLKPANVFLESSGRVKLMDFGIAQSADGSTGAAGEVIGTPQYMAPEQLKGLRGGPAMDVYAFGIVLFEVLTGRRPFSEDSASELLANIASQPIPIDPLVAAGVPGRLIDLVQRATNKDPDHRPRSFSEIIEVLEGVAKPALSAHRIPARHPRRSWLVAAGCSSIVLLSVSGLRHDAESARAAVAVADGLAGVVLPSATLEASTVVVPVPATARTATTIDGTDRVVAERPRDIDRTTLERSETAVVRRDEPADPSDSSMPLPVPNPATVEARTAEAIEWERLKGVADLRALELFQRTYPNGEFAADAREMVATLEWDQLQHSEDSTAVRAFAANYAETTYGSAAARLSRELDAREEARRQIMALVERYAAANRARKVQEIAIVWPGLSAERLRTIEASFANAQRFEFTLEADRAPQLSEPAARSGYASASYRGDATVVCRRRVQMIDRSGMRPDPSESRVAIHLARVDNKWTIVSID
jgi:hypothetical protein